eukprot:6136495-Pyramimonas_sp.AAC.1
MSSDTISSAHSWPSAPASHMLLWRGAPRGFFSSDIVGPTGPNPLEGPEKSLGPNALRRERTRRGVEEGKAI